MHTLCSRRAFLTTALPVLACLLTLTGCTTGDSSTLPDGHAHSGSGIQGQVTRGPLSPVTQAGQTNTAPLPGVVIRVLTPEGTEQARQTTDSQGSYSIAVPAGIYKVQGLAPSGAQGFPTPPAAQTVTVVATQFVTVNLVYDTGIR